MEAEGGKKKGKKKPKSLANFFPAPRDSRQRRALGDEAAAPPTAGGAGRSGGSEWAWGAQGEGGWWGGASAGLGECAGGRAAAADRPAGGVPVAAGDASPRPAAERPGAATVTGRSARNSPLSSRILFLIFPLHLQTLVLLSPSPLGARGSSPDWHLPGPGFPSRLLWLREKLP